MTRLPVPTWAGCPSVIQDPRCFIGWRHPEVLQIRTSPPSIHGCGRRYNPYDLARTRPHAKSAHAAMRVRRANDSGPSWAFCARRLVRSGDGRQRQSRRSVVSKRTYITFRDGCIPAPIEVQAGEPAYRGTVALDDAEHPVALSSQGMSPRCPRVGISPGIGAPVGGRNAAGLV
jgi:hypothetical protein